MFYTSIRAAYDQVSADDLKILANRKDLKIGYFVIADETVPPDIAADNSILKIRFSKPVLRKDLGKCLQ